MLRFSVKRSVFLRASFRGIASKPVHINPLPQALLQAVIAEPDIVGHRMKDGMLELQVEPGSRLARATSFYGVPCRVRQRTSRPRAAVLTQADLLDRKLRPLISKVLDHQKTLALAAFTGSFVPAGAVHAVVASPGDDIEEWKLRVLHRPDFDHRILPATIDQFPVTYEKAAPFSASTAAAPKTASACPAGHLPGPGVIVKFVSPSGACSHGHITAAVVDSGATKLICAGHPVEMAHGGGGGAGSGTVTVYSGPEFSTPVGTVEHVDLQSITAEHCVITLLPQVADWPVFTHTESCLFDRRESFFLPQPNERFTLWGQRGPVHVKFDGLAVVRYFLPHNKMMLVKSNQWLVRHACEDDCVPAVLPGDSGCPAVDRQGLLRGMAICEQLAEDHYPEVFAESLAQKNDIEAALKGRRAVVVGHYAGVTPLANFRFAQHHDIHFFSDRQYARATADQSSES